MTDIQFDRVSIFGDQLSFLIPHDWIESVEDSSNYLYHAPGAKSGWFRVSLISLRTADGAFADELEQQLAERAEKEGGVLYRAGENIVAAWEHASEENGIPIINYWWVVGHQHSPVFSHEALFSYTITKEACKEPRTAKMLSLLLEVAAGAQFTEPTNA